MSALVLAASEVKGPHIDWMAISPLVALTAGACLLLMAGLLRSRFFRHTVVPLLALALIASIGVVLASVYALRMYIRSMHNRVGPTVTSFEMSLRDAVVIVPLVLAIVAFALFPQRAINAGAPAAQSVSQTASGASR